MGQESDWQMEVWDPEVGHVSSSAGDSSGVSTH